MLKAKATVRSVLSTYVSIVARMAEDLLVVQGQMKVILNGVTDSHRRYTQLTGIYILTYITYNNQLYLEYS